MECREVGILAVMLYIGKLQNSLVKVCLYQVDPKSQYYLDLFMVLSVNTVEDCLVMSCCHRAL